MNPAADEHVMRFPTGRMLAAVIVGGAGTVGIMLGASFVPNWNLTFDAAVTSGTGVVVAVAVVVTFAMTPWVKRSMSSWMTIWLAAMVMRMLLTPVAAFLLYSATLPDRMTYGLSIGLSYMLTLFAEAGVLARFVHQKISAAEVSPRSDQRQE